MYSIPMATACYIHIPFCEKICSYCDFYRIVHDETWEERCVSALIREIGLRSEANGNGGARLSSLYFGGGTPTVMSERSWTRLFDALRRGFVFEPDIEATSEANPESSTYDKLSLLRRMGIDRISFGAQSFLPINLTRLGRVHDAGQISRAVENARRAGFGNLSLDLMFGLPDETDESAIDDLRRAADLGPKHISRYALTLEGNVPLKALAQSGNVRLPDDEIVARRYIAGAAYLESRGYRQYEISNYAIKSYESKHNLAYWKQNDYYAYGPSAVGTVGGRRYKNAGDLSNYVGNLVKGELPPHEVEAIDDAKRLREAIMLSLRLAEGLDTGSLRKTYGYDLLGRSRNLIDRLISGGEMVSEGGRLKLTPAGMVKSDAIVVALWPDDKALK